MSQRHKVLGKLISILSKLLKAAIVCVARLALDTVAREAGGTAARIKGWMDQLTSQFLSERGTQNARFMYLASLAELSLLSCKFPPSEAHIQNQVILLSPSLLSPS